MKRIVLFFCFFLFSCSSPKSIIIDPVIFQSHPKPIKIFGIGYWKPGYMVLTLTDANKEYFVIITQRNDSLKVGQFL